MATSSKEYGAHYGRASSTPREPVGRTTLGFLVKNDTGDYIHHQENIAQRTRHGLFSQPMGLANGDQYHDRKPDPVPRNVSTNPRLIDKVGPQLFEKMGSTNIGDIYKDKFREGQLYQKEKNELSLHAHAFMAGGRQKLVKHSEFEHLKEFEDKVYQTRDEQGAVKTGFKNVTTNNMKRGYGNTNTDHLFGAYEYRGTPYDNQKDLESRDKMTHKAKILKPFSNLNAPLAVFTPHHQTFYSPADPYQPRNDDTQYRSKTTQKWTYNNPNKKSFYGTFSEFPKYIEQGEKARPAPAHENAWRHNFNGTLARPSPMPSQMVLNGLRGQH